MPKDTKPPSNKPFPIASPAPKIAADEAKAYRDDATARFAPADNLWDAIRFDVAPLGGIELEPFMRLAEREPPFSDIDEVWFDDESHKPE